MPVKEMLKVYPLAKPKIYVKLFQEMNVIMKSRMRESRTYGFVRGQCREALVYSTCGEIESAHEFEFVGAIDENY